ncbi:hypothetical protein CCUS01_09332 [Colletotrichum cuscutae]|uniref:Uncharacterized protein n=1 Tax=Colletotrichum cuscutae TaxID=1209917 RepID=A0AAI9XSX5_9PEZI|nr:hypothetical protein CCUS01_09332 [Colletotrichum cuscutae]
MESGGTIEKLEASRMSYSLATKLGGRGSACEWLAPRFG